MANLIRGRLGSSKSGKGKTFSTPPQTLILFSDTKIPQKNSTKVGDRKFTLRSIVVMIFFIILFLCSISNEARVIGTIKDEYFKRPILRVDDNQIYIVDQIQKRGYVFGRKDLKKIVEFGNPGDGPSEFGNITGVTVDDRFIYVTNPPRLSVFSRNGKYIKEIRSAIISTSFNQVGKNFIGERTIPMTQEPDYRENTFSLYDSHKKKIKELLHTKILVKWNLRDGKQFIYPISDYTAAAVYKDNIYIGTTGKGFFFSVFNAEGQKLYDINLDVKKKKIDRQGQRMKIESLRKQLGEKRWQKYYGGKEIKYPDYYPAYQSFFVNDGRIYVFCFPQNQQYEIYIMDLKGKLLGKRIKSTTDLRMVIPKYHCIQNGNLYQLREGENEVIELHEVEIYK